MTEQFVLDAAVGGFIDPIGRRSIYTASRLAVLVDGTTMPVLQMIASLKFGKWDDDHFPFWVDGDRSNETSSNVELATRASRGTLAVGPTTRNAFGVPAGTKEYMRKWREKNRDKVRLAQTKYSQRKRTALAEATEALEGLPDVFASVASAIAEAGVTVQEAPIASVPASQKADLRWRDDSVNMKGVL